MELVPWIGGLLLALIGWAVRVEKRLALIEQREIQRHDDMQMVLAVTERISRELREVSDRLSRIEGRLSNA